MPLMTTVGYNTFGEQIGSRDARGQVTTVVRDANGQQVGAECSNTAPGSPTEFKPVIQTQYDEAGRVKKTIDALLRETVYVYDQLGRVASVTHPNGGVSKYTYTLNGEQASVTDPMVAAATYYDMGRKLTATQSLRNPAVSHTTNFAYHATSGMLASVTPPDARPRPISTTRSARSPRSPMVPGCRWSSPPPSPGARCSPSSPTPPRKPPPTTSPAAR